LAADIRKFKQTFVKFVSKNPLLGRFEEGSFMKAASLQCLRWTAALSFLVFAVSTTAAQNTEGSKTPPASEKSTAASAPKPKPGQYASEAEASSHCQGTVVWVDQNNFNHYRGSREWGRKPGAYACEK
jgi:hypothetical protein